MPSSVAPKRPTHITAEVEIVSKAQSSFEGTSKSAPRLCAHTTRPLPLTEMWAERLVPPRLHLDSMVVQVALAASDPFSRSYDSGQALRHRRDYSSPLP